MNGEYRYYENSAFTPSYREYIFMTSGDRLVGCLTTLGTILIGNMSAVAQILPDSTLREESSTVTPNVLIRGIISDRINGGAIRGTNLFHSFEQFSINEGRGAYFANPTGIENIFSRVTGENPSNILGRLGVLGNANLFFINPNGILFGTNASLDVQGSFAGTTANAIQFGELGSFGATNAEVPSQLLTINPSAFLFNPIRPGNIVNRATAPSRPGSSILGLRVGNRENLLLLGGNVNVDGGQLNALGGRVEIGAVAGTGKVGLNADGGLNFPSDVQRADVSFTNGAIAIVNLDKRGDIAITSRNINISGGSFLQAGILPTLGSPDSQAGDITLNATGILQIGERSHVENIVDTNALGNSGDIRITAGSLSLNGRARLDATTFGQGNGGDILIESRDRVSLDDRAAIFNDVEEAGKGTGGNIRISTGSLSVTNGAFITASTDGQGDVGNITIEARDRVSLGRDARIRNGVEENGIGNGGRIHINTRSLSLTDRASISAFNFEQGNAGNLLVDAEEQVSLDKGAGIFNFANIGNGGDIRVSTKSLSIADDARLEASTFRQGNTGNIFIEADERVVLKNDAKIFNGSPNGIGNGGDIRISTELLSVADNAVLRTNTSGQGNAGDIFIDASTISLDGGNISSEVQKLATGSRYLQNSYIL
jgi:filamentous hemagglutinin family protein